MSLSSNSIIHFTNTKENLKGILTENFKVNYCSEEIDFSDKFGLIYAVPMVSFCDIPLSEIKNHISSYGPYGIGLTKEWAEKNNLNPVLYLSKNSELASSYINIYDKYILDAKKNQSNSEKHEKCVVDLLRYMKNYENSLTRAGKVSKNYRFSDEREWRFVPSFSRNFPMILINERYDTEEKKRMQNDKLKKIRLKFEPNDIKYVIIEKDTEIQEFLDLLRTSKGKKYSYREVERVMTRIITTEQILSDF